MPSFISGGNNISVSSTETAVNIPKEVYAIQFSNRGSTAMIISLGGSGRYSLNINGGESKSFSLLDYIQVLKLNGKEFDIGGDGFAGAFTHRTLSGTTTLDFEYFAAGL